MSLRQSSILPVVSDIPSAILKPLEVLLFDGFCSMRSNISQILSENHLDQRGEEPMKKLDLAGYSLLWDINQPAQGWAKLFPSLAELCKSTGGYREFLETVTSDITVS